MKLLTMVCTKCSLEKPMDNFPFDKQKKNGYRRECKLCVKNTPKNLNPVSVRNSTLKYKYGIDQEEYRRLLTEQNGLCAICGSNTPQTKNHNRLCVDHDHTTNKVRGLLCHPCNLGLGSFKDKSALLELAIIYLKKNG